MPPSRRKSGNASTSSRNPAAQSTLAFNDKSARVTKPSAKDPSAKKATSRLSQASPQQDVEDAAHETVELKPEVTEVPIRQQPKAAIVKDEAEQKAEKVTDAQLKRYWKAEEDTRKAPRGSPSWRCPRDDCLFSFLPLTSPDYSTPTKLVHEREDPASFRPLVPIWPLHRHPKTTEVEACERVRPAPAC